MKFIIILALLAALAYGAYRALSPKAKAVVAAEVSTVKAEVTADVGAAVSGGASSIEKQTSV